MDFRSRWPGVAGFLVVLLCWGGAGCGGARPYRAMAKAATSEQSLVAQIDDHRLKASLGKALLSADAANVHITPYVYMRRAYLVGFAASATQRDRAVATAKGVPGVRSLETYLPDQTATSTSTEIANDVAVKSQLKAALALDPGEVVTRIESEVLDGHVVLLGVVSSQSAIDTAHASAREIHGVTGVTSFLRLPEPGYEKRRPSLR